jgi:uncharacterized protein (DUF1778 family)
MEEKDQTIGFRVSPKERELLSEQAKTAGLTLTEYVRSRVFLTSAEPNEEEIKKLLRQLIYITNRTHVAVYSIAEDAGLTSTEDLQKIYARSQRAGIEYLAKLPERIAEVDTELKQISCTAAPAAEKAEA